jgi:multicomponent Na+:H+ antiporter subunit C
VAEDAVAELPLSSIVFATGCCLALIGLWGVLVQRNILRIIIGFSVLDTGINMIMVATGYVTGGTAPIIDNGLSLAEATSRSVDPIPSALVVTAIVIGFSVTAMMLSYAIRMYRAKGTLSIDAFTESKW